MKSKVRSAVTDTWEKAIEEKVDVALQELSPPEERILRLRFGIGDVRREPTRSAEWFLFTPRAVRRIEECALRKLKLSAVREGRSPRSGAG